MTGNAFMQITARHVYQFINSTDVFKLIYQQPMRDKYATPIKAQLLSCDHAFKT
jgi:hypothetical protein